MGKSKHNHYENSPAFGQPGYRNRGNRTGLDPMDSYAEMGYAEGLFLRGLFRGRLRTRNPALLVVMIALGVFTFLPLPLYIKDGIETGDFYAGVLICLVPLAVIGMMFLVNVALSLKPRSKPRRSRKKR